MDVKSARELQNMLGLYGVILSCQKKCDLITSAEEGYVFSSVCLSVCPSDYSQTCERILTKFFWGVAHGSMTKCYNFGGDPDHASDPGVQSPKSGYSGSAKVCGLWAYLVHVILLGLMCLSQTLPHTISGTVLLLLILFILFLNFQWFLENQLLATSLTV